MSAYQRARTHVLEKSSSTRTPQSLLLLLLDMNIDLKELFGDAFTVSNYAANKKLLAAAVKRQINVTENTVKLSDANGCLSWDRFLRLEKFFLLNKFVSVLNLDASFSSVCSKFNEHAETCKNKFAIVWRTIDVLLILNHQHLQTLNLTINFPLDAMFLTRPMLFDLERVRTTLTFEKLTTLTIDNRNMATAVVLDILKAMPNLREVAIRGHIQETDYDNVSKFNPHCSLFDTAYAVYNMPELRSIVSVLPRSLQVLDVTRCEKQDLTLFSEEFVIAVHKHHFSSLETLRMPGVYASMSKRNALPMLKVLPLCPALKRVCLGNARKMKGWQRDAARRLRATTPHLSVDFECT